VTARPERRLKSTLSLYRRHSWWLWTAIAAAGAIGRIAEAAAEGTKVGMGEFIFWVSIALTWMVIHLMYELPKRLKP
jgi:hypothetical protein